MSETKTVTGTLAGIMEKTGDWRELHVAVPGKQYPVKMSTKKEELVQLARAAGENVMEWTYTEQDSGTPNPHQPGKNYINRYFEGVTWPTDSLGPSNPAPVGTAGPESAPAAARAAAPTPQPEEKMSKEEWKRKDSAIHKMACIKTAAAALTHTLPPEPSTDDLNAFNARVLHLALAWHRTVIAERDDPTGEDVPF